MAQPEIMFVIGQLGVGGTESHLAALAPALVRKGWRVSVFSLQGDGPLGEVLAAGDVDVIPTKRGESSPSTRRAARWFRFATATALLAGVLLRKRPQIVHFFLPAAYLIGGPLAVLASVPFRIMSRRSLNTYQGSYPFVLAIEKRLHRHMTAVLGNSLSVVRELEIAEGVPRAKLGLIYNGLDTSRFGKQDRREARAMLGLSPDDLVMIVVANLIPYKGHADLLNALATAKPELPARWRLLIVGRDDGIGLDLKTLAGHLGIAAHIEFLGQRSDIPQLLAAADIGLLCSHEEGFSNALLEGMASGLAMIATDVGGNSEALEDEQSGLLVPAKNVGRLAAALVRLANDPALRTRLGAAARERVAANFSLEKCIESYDALYRALLAGRSVNEVDQVRIAMH